MIRYYLCVDDTDDLTKKTSTGKIAEHIKKEAESLGSVIDYGITRHQLLLDCLHLPQQLHVLFGQPLRRPAQQAVGKSCRNYHGRKS